MIIYPCTSLFDCLYPQLEDNEKEIIYQHPFLPGISCNQIGVIYYDEDVYSMYHKFGIQLLKFKKSINVYAGSRYKICWECYHQEKCSKGIINLLDMNPYNCTKENLYFNFDLKETEYRERIIYKKKFINKTVKLLEEFAQRHTNLSIEEIMNYFNLNKIYITAWTSNCKDKKIKPIARAYKYTEPKHGDEERVKELFFSGVKYRDIVKEMDWGSTRRVKKIVDKFGWERENPRFKK